MDHSGKNMVSVSEELVNNKSCSGNMARDVDIERMIAGSREQKRWNIGNVRQHDSKSVLETSVELLEVP